MNGAMDLGPPTWVWRVFAGTAVFVALAVVAVVVVVGVGFLDRQDQQTENTAQLRDTQRIALAINARSDCRAAIGSVYSQLTDDRDNAFQQSIVLSLTDRAAALRVVDDQLTPLIATIRALPKRAVAYERGLTVERVETPSLVIEAERLPACPKVN